MSLEKKPHVIFYIGKKPVKQDTVAGTGLIWNGFGDSHLVGHTQAIQLLQHPDVWCGEKRFNELQGDASPQVIAETSGLSELANKQLGAETAPAAPAAPAAATPSSPDGDNTQDGKEPSPPATDPRQTLIINALLSLDTSNEEHFSVQTGQPKINAVRDAANDQTLEVKEINLAWKTLKANAGK